MSPFKVFFDDKYIANKIYYSTVEPKFNIIIDTELEPSINVHLHDGTRIVFNQCGGDLYYFDSTKEEFEKYRTT